MKQTPLVVHLIYKLDFGGLETLMLECVNRMPADKYRHAIICLKDYTEFSKKISRPDVQIFALNKPPGLGLATHLEIYKLFRQLKPTVLHSYNLSSIEYTLAACLAGVPVRVHAEHGRDASDPEGKNWKHNLLRKLMCPLVDSFVPVSGDLQRWLKSVIGVPDSKNLLINNGVDIQRFQDKTAVHALEKVVPANNSELSEDLSSTPKSSNPLPFPADSFIIGTVGRIQDVKNHADLVRAFIALQNSNELLPLHKEKLRLAIIGDGALLPVLKTQVEQAGIADHVWLPGARQDIAAIIPHFSVFAMTSIAEGTPVVVLEAMACGLPVVASKVGGIPEVVKDQINGKLVAFSAESAFPESFAKALSDYLLNPALLQQHGEAGRQSAQKTYSVEAMINAYVKLYDDLSVKKLNAKSVAS